MHCDCQVDSRVSISHYHILVCHLSTKKKKKKKNPESHFLPNYCKQEFEDNQDYQIKNLEKPIRENYTYIRSLNYIPYEKILIFEGTTKLSEEEKEELKQSTLFINSLSFKKKYREQTRETGRENVKQRIKQTVPKVL